MNAAQKIWIKIVPGKRSRMVDINLFPVWLTLKIPKIYKEFSKVILFQSFPFLFKKFWFYHRWKNSLVFSGPLMPYWKGILSKGLLSPHRPISMVPFCAKVSNPLPIQRVAVVIHAFYPDIFEDILMQLTKAQIPNTKLYVTAPPNEVKTTHQILQRFKFDYHFEVVENNGRDVLPFLKVLPLIIEERYPLLLKLHTKKSDYLGPDNDWKDDILKELISSGRILQNIRIFERYLNLGLLGPKGHCLPMSLFYGANAETVKNLCLKLGLSLQQLQGLYFIAGTMFFARPESLRPILDLRLSDADFKSENELLDGTLAHAMERVFAAAILKNNQVIADTSSSLERLHCELKLTYAYSM